MRRLEAMADERAAIRSLMRSAMFDPPLALALKSGNFGTVDFFEKALATLDGAA